MAYIGSTPGFSTQRVVTTFTATGGQTSFSPTGGYVLNYVDVYYNGVKLIAGDDFSATNGTSVTLTVAASAGDSVEVVSYIPRGLSDGYTKLEADARYLALTGGTLTGNLTLSGSTANSVLYLNGSKVATGGSALTFDGKILGLGATPAAWDSTLQAIVIKNTAVFTGQTNSDVMRIGSNWYYNAGFKYQSPAAASIYEQGQGTHIWYSAASGVAGNSISWSQLMTLNASGNLGIGGTADARSRLQIKGTLPTDGGNSLPIVLDGTIPSGTTSQAQMFRSNPTTQATSFTLSNLSHFVAGSAAFGAGSTVVNQYGFWATNQITNATNNYGFYSDIASGSNRWNFYAAGTARNYFTGRTDVGGTRIEAAPAWNGARVTSNTSIVLDAGATVTLASTVCGGAIISVYVEGSGNGGLFWANYSQVVAKITGNGEATDTGSDFAVYKNAASHTVTLKNKAAVTQTFTVSVFGANVV